MRLRDGYVDYVNIVAAVYAFDWLHIISASRRCCGSGTGRLFWFWCCRVLNQSNFWKGEFEGEIYLNKIKGIRRCINKNSSPELTLLPVLYTCGWIPLVPIYQIVTSNPYATSKPILYWTCKYPSYQTCVYVYNYIPLACLLTSNHWRKLVTL